MSESTVIRTTVSIDREIYALAKKRMRALRIRKFSRFVELLLERDISAGGSITVVKEEAPAYLRVPARYSGHLKQSAGRKAPARKSR